MTLESNVGMIFLKFALQFNHGIMSSSIHWDPERQLKPIHHSQIEIEGGKFLAMLKKGLEHLHRLLFLTEGAKREC